MADVDIFSGSLSLPDLAARRRYEALTGLDEVKIRLLKQARIMLKPTLLDAWANEHHGGPLAVIEVLRDRAPLFIFAGDVGTGKTTLAETFGDALGLQDRITVEVMRLSLNARGSGMVGEMTTLITDAFEAVKVQAPPLDGDDPSAAVVLLIDEADALAQSRENAHMHHEDRAGVNALIRGIDSIATERRPVITILCTNRLDDIDPAVRRRAFEEFEFARPDQGRRIRVLTDLFEGVELEAGQLEELALLTGEREGRSYPCTYSDLTQRLASTVVLEAFPDRPLQYDAIRAAAAALTPTPPFGGGG